MRELSHKIRAAYEHKAFIRKQCPCGKSAYGYRWDKELKQHVIDSDAEHIVRAIHNAFDQGKHSLSDFVLYCNQRKLLPKSGIPWQKGRMEHFLKNPIYTGWFRFKGKLIEGSHPQYISKHRFDERLRRLSRRQNGRILNRRAHLLSRFVRCAECGRSYEAEMQHGAHNSGDFTYYKHRCSAIGSRKEKRIPERVIFQWLDDLIRNSRFHPDFAQSLREMFKKPVQENEARQKKELSGISRRLSRLESQKSKLLDLFTLNQIDPRELLEKREQYQAEIELLNREFSSFTTASTRVFDEIGKTIQLLQEMPVIFLRDIPEGKIKILRTMAEYATLSETGEFRLAWLKPYSFLMRTEIIDLSKKTEIIQGRRTPGSRTSYYAELIGLDPRLSVRPSARPNENVKCGADGT